MAGQSGSVQLLDAQQSKAAATPFRWFSPAERPLDAGEIDSHHTLLALVHRIYSQRLTGKLQLVFGRVEKALFFDAGEVVFATSSDRQDGLGEVMLRAGALTQGQFEEASALVETGQRFGSAIAEMGIYGVEQIVSWVQRQILQITASALDYPAGRYSFFSSLEKDVLPEIGIPVPLGRLLLAAVRKAGDLPLEQLAEDAELQVEPSSDALRLLKAEDLEDGERRLLSLISQHISAKDVVAQSGLPKSEASRALYALMLLGFVGAAEQVRPELAPVVPAPAVPEPVVPSAAAAPEQPSAVEAASASKIPEQRTVDVSVPAEEVTAKASETPSAGSSAGDILDAQPHLEQTPDDAEEPIGTEPLPTTPLPLLKPNAIAREVPVRATGNSPEKNERGRQLFHEETSSVLVAETGGVIRLCAAVTAGQLLVLANVESKREVIVQILRKRSYKPTMCYLEVEFVEAAPRFWGTEFSAATALLPKNTQDVETAALVITAESTADQPWVLPTAPDASELQRFKREMEELRGKPVSTESPATNEEASALAQLRGEVYPGSAIHEPGHPLSTEAILESGLDAAGAPAPAKRAADPAPWEAAEQVETPQTVADFINSLPKTKRWQLPRGGFTPEFNRVLLVLAILLVVLGVGTAWRKNWLPWKSAAAKPKKVTAYDNVRVVSDAPLTSAGMPTKSAPVSDAGATAPADGSAAPVEAASPDVPVERSASTKKASREVTAAKASSVRPAAKPVANSEANSGKDSAVVPPKLIHSVQAVASLEALRDFERGNVVVDAVVGTSGEVHFISVISGPPSLREPAVEALKQFKYEPATRSGQPVPAHVTITIHFHFES
ncbi:MAG: TonB family protein [Candidatus Acidiferrum sp.]